MDFWYGDVVDYFKQLHKSAREHFGAAADSGDGPLGYGNRQQLLWLQIILCTLSLDPSCLSGDEAAALDVYFGYGLWSSSMQANDVEWAVSTCNAISDHLETEGPSSKLKTIDQRWLGSRRGYLIEEGMGLEKPLTNVLLPGEIIFHPRVLHILMSYPDKVLPEHTARFASRRRTLRRRLRTT